VIDPDLQVQQSVRLLFETFRRTGSAMATVKHFADQELQFPRRVHTGPNKGDVVWAGFEHSRVLRILHIRDTRERSFMEGHILGGRWKATG
jgi:hypothetical protein